MPHMRNLDWKKVLEQHLEELFYSGKTEIPRWLILRAYEKLDGGRVVSSMWDDMRSMFCAQFQDSATAESWTYSTYKLTPDQNNTTTPHAFLLVMDNRLLQSRNAE